jgi:hypothetical protein
MLSDKAILQLFHLSHFYCTYINGVVIFRLIVNLMRLCLSPPPPRDFVGVGSEVEPNPQLLRAGPGLEPGPPRWEVGN